MKTKQYTVGEYSRQFLNALDTFQEFKNDFLTALQTLYGEEQGDKIYNEHAQLYDDVERTVMDYLRYNFVLEMGTAKDTITI